MMRIAALPVLLSITLIGGCAAEPPPVWYKDGATSADFERDKAQCVYEITAATQNTDPTMRTVFGQEMERAQRQKQLAPLCMKAKGWHQ